MNSTANTPEIRPFPWKCGNCRQREVYPVEEEYTTKVVHDGRRYTVTVPDLRLFRCRNCGEAVLDTEASEQITQAFRRQAGLLTPEQIRRNRKALRLKQGELAARLGVAKATLSRWETGAQIQQRSLDNLLRLYFKLPQVRASLGRPSGAAGKFRCLEPTAELRREAEQFQLTFGRRPVLALAAAEQPEEQGARTGGATPAEPHRRIRRDVGEQDDKTAGAAPVGE